MSFLKCVFWSTLLNKCQLRTTSVVSVIFLVGCLIFLQIPLNAATSESAIIEQLQKQIVALSARITALEQTDVQISHQLSNTEPLRPEKAQLDIASSVTSSKTPSWSERIKLKGDLRSRYENIEDDLKSEDRNRHRVRARLAILADISDRWSTGIGLATGGDAPVSSNQTLGGGASTKDIGLDLAYINFAVSNELSLTSGKFGNPFYQVGGYHMLWDSDYRPEGFAFSYSKKNLWATGMIHFLESDDGAGSKDTETSYGLQTGFSHSVSADMSLVGGISYYQFNVKGSHPFFGNSPLGNTVTAQGTYAQNYQQMEIFAELSTNVGELPLSGFIDYVNNLDINEQDTGWAAGIKLGKASAANTWEIVYRYQNLEADAVYAATTDSDFAGGRSDNRGHLLQAAYAPYKNTKFSVKYLITDYGKHNSGFATDYNRLQVDLALKF